MNRAQRLAQWVLDLAALHGAQPKEPRRLTGLEKMALEEPCLEDQIQAEYDKVFGDKP
jgi:hypothetical protein